MFEAATKRMKHTTPLVDADVDVYFKQGWEASTMVEDPWLGGVLSPVYKIALKRKIN